MAGSLERIRIAGQHHCHLIASEIVAEIARLAPHGETGALAQSFYVDTDDNGDAVIRCHVDYWRYPEFGTHEHGRAQPYIRPAVETVRARHR